MMGTKLDVDSRIIPGEWAQSRRKLNREFAAPVALLDPDGPYWHGGPSAEQLPTPEATLDWANSAGILGARRVALWRPDGEEGPTWLGLPLQVTPTVVAVALVGFASLEMENPVGLGPCCPDNALKAWGQTVADAGFGESAMKSSPSHTSADDYQLIARLVRRLRISDPPERFQGLATTALRAA